MKLPSFPVAGGCQCRTVRYEITAAPLSVYNCHCKDCQRSSGSTHTMSMFVRREDFRVVSGDLATYDKAADSGRTVRMQGCSQCGTKLWNEPLAAPQFIVLKPGTLDDMSWAAPIGNIWTASKAPWVVIDETLLNYPGQPPDRQPLFDAWTKVVATG
jgi:hypothetical protein